jgi:hypothetical protein
MNTLSTYLNLAHNLLIVPWNEEVQGGRAGKEEIGYGLNILVIAAVICTCIFTPCMPIISIHRVVAKNESLCLLTATPMCPLFAIYSLKNHENLPVRELGVVPLIRNWCRVVLPLNLFLSDPTSLSQAPMGLSCGICFEPFDEPVSVPCGLFTFPSWLGSNQFSC